MNFSAIRDFLTIAAHKYSYLLIYLVIYLLMSFLLMSFYGSSVGKTRANHLSELKFLLEGLQGVSNKVAAPKLLGIFSLLLSLFAWNFANMLAVHIHIYMPIFCSNISSNDVNIFTSTHHFYPVKFSVGLFTQKMKMQLFGNDISFRHRVS